jgi:hypothetical protein
MIIGRFLLRLLLVPLGGCVAICVAMMVVLIAQWNRFAALNGDDISGLTAAFVIGPMLAVSMAFMLLPAMLAALIAEAFAIRSLFYHAICGGLSAWVSLATIGALDKDYDFSNAPLVAVGAGIAAGFAYWAIAGWSAGFWKPVFKASRPDDPPPPAVAPAVPAALAKPDNEIAGHSRPKDGVAPLADDPAIRNSAIRPDD